MSEFPEFGTVVDFHYPEAPGFGDGGVVLSRHALAQIEREDIPAALFERALQSIITERTLTIRRKTISWNECLERHGIFKR